MTLSYTYDALYRLAAADYSTGEQYAYQYDPVGNRTAMTDTAVRTYAYDAANRLTNADGVLYTWDGRGNLLSDGTFTYTYNAAGRMVRAESLTTTLVYTYNADGLRVARSQSVQSVQSVDTFTWDWATGVPELLSDGESLYLIGYDTLGWQSGTDWTFVLPDALGSVRQETDAAGAVTAAHEWSPYGEEVGGAQTGLGFTGEWFDAAVRLTYLRARWYDGGTGRFTQVDPWAGDTQQPLSLNDYLYALAQPINGTDPSGWYTVKDWIKMALMPYGVRLDETSPNYEFTDDEAAMVLQVVQDYTAKILENGGPETFRRNVGLRSVRKLWGAKPTICLPWDRSKCLHEEVYDYRPYCDKNRNLDTRITLPPYWLAPVQKDFTFKDWDTGESTVIQIDYAPSVATIVEVVHFTYNPFDSLEQASKFVLAHEMGHALNRNNQPMFDSFVDNILLRNEVIERGTLPYYNTYPSLKNNQLVIHARNHTKGDPYKEIFADAMAAYLYVPTLLTEEMRTWFENERPSLVMP